jgi:hypothetical protein
MNNQQIFDKVSRHLLKQGTRSTDELQCVYRGPGGLKCAIGVLIPDEAYDPKMEGVSAAGIIDQTGVDPDKREIMARIRQATGLGEENKALLESLQRLHDRGDVDNWDAELRAVATHFNLKFRAEQCAGIPASVRAIFETEAIQVTG